MWIRLLRFTPNLEIDYVANLDSKLEGGNREINDNTLSSLYDISFASWIAFFRCGFAIIDLFKVFFRDFVAVVEFRVLIHVFFNSY